MEVSNAQGNVDKGQSAVENRGFFSKRGYCCSWGYEVPHNGSK